uniref:Uncharacterized protein n=1 Tax=viral metagenome TaxID=1070528 RepID=A0A6C0ATI3_9ZZZZ
MKEEYYTWITILLLIITIVLVIGSFLLVEGYSNLNTTASDIAKSLIDDYSVDSSNNSTKYDTIKWTSDEDISDVSMNVTSSSTDTTDVKFDSNDYDIEYHATTDQLALDDPSIVIDKSGNLYSQSGASPQPRFTYYEPGKYMFGSSNYVPDYKDSIYLSTLMSSYNSTNYIPYNNITMNGVLNSKIEDDNEKILDQWPTDSNF